jgi:orotate phosphoribosyltransferase
MSDPASLIARVRAAACQRGPFRLPTEQVIEDYFDEYLLASDPVLLHDVATQMARQVPAKAEVLVGLELGGVPLAVALSAATGTFAGFLRGERKSYGTGRQVEGPVVTGRDVILVDDVVRSGAQLLAAATVLRCAGARVATAICVLDRGLDGRARLAEHHIVLRSLFTPADIYTERTARQAGRAAGVSPTGERKLGLPIRGTAGP